MVSAGKRKRYITYNRIRLALFIRTYAAYSIFSYLRSKYKVKTYASTKTIRKQFSHKKNIPELNRLAEILQIDYSLLWQTFVQGKVHRQFLWFINQCKPEDRDKIKAFLTIEKELIALSIGKKDKESLIKEEYERKMLSVAIERVVGNSLKNEDDEHTFELQLQAKQKEYIRWYYATAYKYKLPTLRIVPFILRLISS